METNLIFNQILSIYDVAADDFGDTLTIGLSHKVRALVENTLGWEHDNYADQNTGVIRAQISSTEPIYLNKKGRLFGLVAQFSRHGLPDDNDWYKIVSVKPGESLFDGSPDVVELTLTLISKRDSKESEPI